ncbi:phosphoglucomutase, cytoplasmic-like [Salvia splendens]|uniref:phosphoglucomutase, cytoplasmic-like n=1 Tax=Salvia splendens TaxID=180675 RepID=UPI001C278CC1|nr:phosphoglucomutase, cytoplasmic-like [Salvia splendens]
MQKDVLSTPAHSGAASQRNAAVVEDNTLEQVCGTRRFARLAEESATVLKGANLFSRKELFVDDIQDFKRAYARRIIVEELGAKESSLLNCAPKKDFGRGHPDHNLTYARELVARVGLSKSDNNLDPPEFGAAADGDVDHNMEFGKGFFVAPSDFVVIIAAYVVQPISYFPGGLKGVARSMPTLAALDVL